MQYRPQKNKKAAATLTLFFLTASVGVIFTGYLPSPPPFYIRQPLLGLFVACALYTVGRFLVFDFLFRLGDGYADFTFTVYRIYRESSTPFVTIELTGKERLVKLDKAAKKAKVLKKQKKLFVFTVNIKPKDRYALFCMADGKEGYLLLELDTYAAAMINDRIKRAETYYSITSREQL